MDDNDQKTGSAAYLRLLADCLGRNEETTLGPTDRELCAQALRDRADRAAKESVKGVTMIDGDNADLAGSALALAKCLEATDETTLGPTDAHLAAVALLDYAAFLDANALLPA